MASETELGAQEPEKAAEPKVTERRGMRRRKKKIIIAVIAVAIALVIIIWGWSSTGRSYLSVETVIDNATEYEGEEIEVKGIVSEYSGGQEFTLADENDTSKSIDVVMTGTFPSGFENGKVVAVKGIFNSSSLSLTATEITIGCASKY